jgi:integrase
MPLKLVPRPNGILRIRGTIQGRRIDESSGTRVRAEAEQIKAKLEADLFKRAVYGDDSVATFAEAAAGYMLAGGAREHLRPLLLRLGDKRLIDVTQSELDAVAAEKPDAKPATLLRQIYTPASAVMNFAASDAGGRLCRPITFRKPKVKNTRVEFLTPDQAEAWIEALPDHLSRLVTFLLATGCRISEALDLKWKDISKDNRRIVLWETKADYPRGVDLQERARKALPPRPKDPETHVWLNSRGEPWHGYDAINGAFKKVREPTQRKTVRTQRARRAPRHDLAPLHCHLLRHTWATWAYACTRDLTFLMGSGGWRSLTMVGRYVHAASPDSAQSVVDANWAFLGRELPGLKPKELKRQ